MSHYDWLDVNLGNFLENVGIPRINSVGLAQAHGDKCYSYKNVWKEAGIPFNHGVALYLLTYLQPFNKEVRETNDGWVAPWSWVVENYTRFKKYFE